MGATFDFLDMKEIALLIYKAGGINPGGYGFISGGYGGGLDQDEFFRVVEFRGFLQGVKVVSQGLADRLMAEINTMLVNEFEVPREQTPFINLSVAW